MMRIAIARILRVPQARVVALLVFVNLFVIALTAVSLHASYRQVQERAAIASRNTNRLVAQGIAGEIDRIDLGLRAVADEYGRMLASGGIDEAGLSRFVVRQRERLPMLDSLRWTDAQGRIAESGVSAADRDYFIRPRDDPGAGLVISKPILGRISGKEVLVFARRLEAPVGGFAGIVYAAVTIDWFERKFDALEVGPHGAVVLRGDASRDFDLLARFPAAGFVGQTKVSRQFRAAISAAPSGGTYQAHAGADDILRTFSYQPVGAYPLITLVGLASQDYLNDWRPEAVKMTILAAVFAVVTSIGALRMLRAWRALEQQTQELARSNADLEQFAYVASHDLQTPLRNIASYAQLLGKRYRGRLDRDADEFIGFLVDGAKQMAEMIGDLRDYAQIPTTQRAPVAVDLGRIVETVRTTLAERIEAAGATIVSGPLPVVLAETPLMETLFQNLIENALTYRDPGRPLRVDITARPAGEGFWRIAVADNGIGIDPAYQEKVFVIFQRLSPAQFPGGTGIGLALCRRIVHRFGGTIGLDPVPGTGTGTGTVVFFTLRGNGQHG